MSIGAFVVTDLDDIRTNRILVCIPCESVPISVLRRLVRSLFLSPASDEELIPMIRWEVLVTPTWVLTMIVGRLSCWRLA